MKKILFSALILSLLLATLTACGAEAQQPTTPEPAPQANQIEPEKPELPADPTPEPLADVKSATEPEPVADVEPEPAPAPAPENILTFTDCNETVYATDTVNLRSGPSTDDEKIGSLSAGDSVTRTGIGTGDYENWSRVVLSDGTEVYVNNNYISTTKPVIQQSTSKPSSSPATKPSSQSSGASSGSTSGGGASGGGSSGDANKEWAESRGQGLAGILDYVPDIGEFEEGAAEGVYGDPSVRVNMG